MLKIAIQTNVWSDEIHRTNFTGMLAEIAAAGYQGIEIGAHRLDLERPALFKTQLEAHGLEPAGLHTHGALFDAAELGGTVSRVERAAAFAAAVGAPFVLISGKPLPGKTPAQQAQETAALQQCGRLCQAHGRRLCYHNHYWEVEHDYRELRFLLENTDPALVGLALDVGWVQRAGGRPAEAVRRFNQRIDYLHLKDFRVKDFASDTWTELGDGYVDFPGVFAAIEGRSLPWAAVERDEVLPHAAQSSRSSRDYLRGLGL